MNILLIEDEQRIADFIVAGFTDVGFTTHWEQDGFRGLNFKQRPSACLTGT